MKIEMTPRERVEAVLNLSVPDTVPIGDGLFQHWGFINHYCKTKEKGKWSLEEICRAVGNSKVDYAFDLAPSLEPHREKRLGLTYQITEWTEVDLSFFDCRFDHPVYVDMLTGRVLEIPADHWKQENDKVVFKEIPVSDSVVLISEKSLTPIWTNDKSK